jgi:hypothetical protein
VSYRVRSSRATHGLAEARGAEAGRLALSREAHPVALTSLMNRSVEADPLFGAVYPYRTGEEHVKGLTEDVQRRLGFC